MLLVSRYIQSIEVATASHDCKGRRPCYLDNTASIPGDTSCDESCIVWWFRFLSYLHNQGSNKDKRARKSVKPYITHILQSKRALFSLDQVVRVIHFFNTTEQAYPCIKYDSNLMTTNSIPYFSHVFQATQGEKLIS